MAETLLELTALVLGFAALTKGATWLVDGGAELARRWGVRPMTVGLTVIAWGTSMPEVVVSSLASQRDMPEACLGNVLGSNIANIGLVLGVTGLILPAVLRTRLSGRDALWLVGSLGIVWGFLLDGKLTRIEGFGLISAFLIYNVALFRLPRSTDVQEESETAEVSRPWPSVVGGSVSIALGGWLVLFGAEALALRVGISERVVGLTVLAIGTSLPELAASVQSALRGHPAMGVGNVVGSNVFNSLTVMGIAAVVRPFQIAGPDGRLAPALTSDFPINLGFSLLLVILALVLRGGATRIAAFALVVAYVAYSARVLTA